MDFKLLSKNNIGAVSTLILVILLTQARVFDFLIDTALGMFILIIFILGISYMNHNLGLVAVLVIILMMNQNDFGYLEGFSMKNTINQIKQKGGSNASTSEKDAAEKDAAEKASNEATQAKSVFESAKRAMDQANKAAVTAAAAQKSQAEQKAADAKAKEEQAQAAYKAAQQQALTAAMAAKAGANKESFVGGREGFNMIDREGTMLKGKRSNEIPVLYNSRSQSDDDVEPMDSSMFKNSYSLF